MREGESVRERGRGQGLYSVVEKYRRIVARAKHVDENFRENVACSCERSSLVQSREAIYSCYNSGIR